MKKRIIIDTDFGGDPDDILALLYALNSPSLEIAAIISNDEYRKNHRAKAIKYFIHAAQRRIPVFTGTDLGNENFFLLKQYTNQTHAPPSFLHSQQFIRILESVNAKKNGYYLAIGGLANLARLYTTHAKNMNHIHFFIMAGTLKKTLAGRGEHNARLDPVATRTILASHLNMRWILSDHTFVRPIQISRNHEVYRRIAINSSPAFAIAKANLDAFYDTKYPESYLHDPITLSSILLPVAHYKKRRIVCTDSGCFRQQKNGYSTWTTNKLNYKLFCKNFLHTITP